MLHFALVIFTSKLIEAKFKFIFFAFFRFFFAFFAFSAFFSLYFNLVIFASKRNERENFSASKEPKFNIFCIISLPNFVLGEKIKHFYQFFRLIFFTLRFLVFSIKVNHVKSGFLSLPRETKYSPQFQILLPKRKWGRTLGHTEQSLLYTVVEKCCFHGTLFPCKNV